MKLTLFAPQGMLGYGYPAESFERGLSFEPDMIGVDAGSTDAGPYRLGSGRPTVSEEAVYKDLKPMVIAALNRRIPLIVGSAGGAGARPHVEWVLEILKKILKEEKLSARVGIILSDVDKGWLKDRLRQGRVKPLGPVKQLSEEEIDAAANIVAVMGIDPYIEALERGCQIIIAGRSNDPAIFASFAIHRGAQYGFAFHAGKILECGAIASIPGTASDGIVAIIEKDCFHVEPASQKRRCTKLSVAAHSLYEKEHPYLIPGPEGILNIKEAKFLQETERRVRVEGSAFEHASERWIKIEGAKAAGYRSIFIAFIKDPIAIEAYPEWSRAVVDAAKDYFGEDHRIIIHFKGEKEATLILEAIAESQEKAQAICSWARSYLMHYHYTGRKSTSGNLAIPFSPFDIPMGRVYEFNIHHLVREEPGIFTLNIEKM